jgi:2-oxoglutarate/2-oxoacid ferredoxin oxidoreductase subunit beta
VIIPQVDAQILEIDFKEHKVTKQNWALASLAVIASRDLGFNINMLTHAIQQRFNPKVSDIAMKTIGKFI